MKVGIVGRTGSGKSSILQILFRLTDPEKDGKVLIDGQDITTIGLHLLRKSIAYIPQSPFLIQGTVRENIDPFKNYSDSEVWECLASVELKTHVQKMDEGLLTKVKDGTNLFSMGQKQLMCLARAMLLNTKVIVLDEATANVDLKTDNFIQTKLRDSFTNRNATVLLIAHRLATVIDADRILVMGNGKKLEFDHPFNLLAKDVNNDTEITNTEGAFA